ncbi:dual specificity protein phosphatase family protein [Desulfoluna spongiiphila]|uniref:dual specificity protein phosphatase family protein n=1 Tax=Desulfoluna spongiiphila TaxID=419481 RepID=UPI00125785B7|nr:dual specificity protein phosphatase family protein [Desulfoluna spongiiphila]VVS94764.1 tyrosine/serine-protein phosphatase iphp-type [Desulfoluna spongiiphila]
MRIMITLAMCLVMGATAYGGEEPRPRAWAVPMSMEGVPNLHRLDEGVYRSAQPSALGMKNLESWGIKTVINLRLFHSDTDEARGTGLRLVRVPMKTWAPDEIKVTRFFSELMDPSNRPVLFHCWHGADRTGVMGALYRVVVQGWTKEEAIDEMVHGGYGFHPIWFHLPGWVRDMDVDVLKKEFTDGFIPLQRGVRSGSVL